MRRGGQRRKEAVAPCLSALVGPWPGPSRVGGGWVHRESMRRVGVNKRENLVAETEGPPALRQGPDLWQRTAGGTLGPAHCPQPP